VILPSVPGSAGNTPYVSDPRFPNLSEGASRPVSLLRKQFYIKLFSYNPVVPVARHRDSLSGHTFFHIGVGPAGRLGVFGMPYGCGALTCGADQRPR